GGNAFVTDPSMAMAVGPIIFVVTVVGGMGSLAGAFIASLVIGVIQVMATGMDTSLATLFRAAGWNVTSDTPLYAIWSVGISQIAPILPYLLLILVLIFRPRGLMGTRET